MVKVSSCRADKPSNNYQPAGAFPALASIRALAQTGSSLKIMIMNYVQEKSVISLWLCTHQSIGPLSVHSKPPQHTLGDHSELAIIRRK